ncbi:MAG: agmatinase [Thermoplasmata archaeon]|nr:agmatinase [Thermoplasmata archaeon]
MERKNRPIALLGIPFDEQSSFSRGAAHAPAMIRSAWLSPSTNLYSENGLCIDTSAVRDLGDLDIRDKASAFATIEGAVDRALSERDRLVCLGGDHSITYPIMRAFSRHHRDINLVQFDAHPDLYDSFEGNRHSHACPFARIMEESLVKSLVQVGVRTMTKHTHEQAERFGVRFVDMVSLGDDLALSLKGPTYVSVDIDALDPAFAPGVSHREPGGMTTRQVLRIIQRLDAPIVGADIVEYNPSRDIPGMTDMVCAKIMKELAARMLAPDIGGRGVQPRTGGRLRSRNGKR